jgi:hypothetical protein
MRRTDTGAPAMGIMITMENGYTIYFSGSTDVTLDRKLWGEMFQPDAAQMAKFLSEGNPNLTTCFRITTAWRPVPATAPPIWPPR